MSSVIRGAALALLLVAPRLGLSQQAPLTWPLPGELVKEGIALHDKEDYPGAIAKYQAVTPGDSSYASAQTELAMSLYMTGKNEEAVAAARRAIALRPFHPPTYNVLANALDGLKQPDAALAAYQQGLRLFPYNQTLYYNQGATLLNQPNRTADALASLAHGLELRPTHANSHRVLGVLAAMQGQTSHTLISWLTCLALGGPSAANRELLLQTERLAQNVPVLKEGREVKPVAPNAAFEDLDQLLQSKVALQKSYESKVKFGAAVVKQAQLLIEKFPVDGPAEDIWIRAYGPLVASLRQGDNLTTFTYLVLQSAEDESARQWVRSNKGKVETLLRAVLPALATLRARPQVVGGAPGQRLDGWFNADDKLTGMGPGQITADGFRGTGTWLGISPEGAVTSKGQFNSVGKPTGAWKKLRPDGSLTEDYVCNDQGGWEGVRKEYYPNGQLSLEATYVHDNLSGPATTYNECGARTSTQQYKDGKLDGPYVSYRPNGQVEYRSTMLAGKTNGPEEAFYPDGALEYTATSVNGLRQGISRSYFADKRLAKEVNYDQGQLHGDFKRYAANGVLIETGRYERGQRAGLWHELTAEGKPSIDKSYEAGELHGLYKEYDPQGHVFGSTEYSHGRVKQWQYFDAAGKPTVTGTAGKSRVTARLPDATGRPASAGDYLAGLRVGEWKSFYRDGGLQQIIHFDNAGQATGTSEEYYANGQLMRREHLGPDGQREGHYEVHFVDGEPKETGYYHAGQRQGPWKTYYANGRVYEESEYHRDQLNGAQREYTPSGKLTQERAYEFGKLHRWLSYDSTGREVGRAELQASSREMVLPYQNSTYRLGVACFELSGPGSWLQPNGQALMNLSYLGGERTGECKLFWPDGKMKEKCTLLAGAGTGEWLEYDINGKLYSRQHFNTAGEDGESSYYYPDGQLAFTETHLNGMLHGPMRHYNPAGELLIEKNYEGGHLRSYRGPGPATAPWIPLPLDPGPIRLATTFANGKPAAEETMQHGWLAGPAAYYYASGQVFQRIDYLKTVRHGLSESFYANGKVMSRESYQHGQRQGRCQYYRPDGTLDHEATYRCGQLNGPTTVFDAAGRPLHTDQYWNRMVYGGKK
jgi:antitoxin component YwqK of YwqJK toxin-antitoxin module/tetratricopeptide (TPR) repeat protein